MCLLKLEIVMQTQFEQEEKNIFILISILTWSMEKNGWRSFFFNSPQLSDSLLMNVRLFWLSLPWHKIGSRIEFKRTTRTRGGWFGDLSTCCSFRISSRGQFHQHSTGSFYASRITLNLLRVYSVEVRRNGEVGHYLVGETEWRWRIPTGAFALCARRLVKLTPGGVQPDHSLFFFWRSSMV